MEINEYAHLPFLKKELQKFLPGDSFAGRAWQQIGGELHYRLVEWEDTHETEYSTLFPMDALYTWGLKSGGLDHEWLASETGGYFDNEGNEIPSDISISISVTEQLAAYGLWLIMVEHDSHGEIPEEGLNDYGWSREEAIEHSARCMLLAYQALAYANKILRGEELSQEEKEKAQQQNFSALGKKGANKRHAPTRVLRQYAIELYKSGSWPSANQAAHSLKNEIVIHGKKIGAHLSPENAQRTISEWFRKSV